MTESLFTQYKKVNIEYPYGEGYADSGFAHEGVTAFDSSDKSNEDEYYAFNDSAELDTSVVYRLDEIQVKVLNSFASERNGKMAIDFLIRVPKELISPSWRMTLSPKLIDRDTIMPLDEIILHGSKFRAFQKQGYAAYDEFINSIVELDDYIDAFLDEGLYHKDLRKIQSFGLKLYYQEWHRRQMYQKWRIRYNKRHIHFNLKKDANRARLARDYNRKASFKRAGLRLQGRDTTGVNLYYSHKFHYWANLLPKYWLHREPNIRSFPAKYRDIYLAGDTLKPISSYPMTEKDSLDLRKDRLDSRKIAENEMKSDMMDIKFKELVPFPYRKDVKVDTLFYPEHDFFYLYRHNYPITPGVKKVRIYLKSRVDAIDMSDYTLPDSDTLTYVLAGLEQLIDTSLVYRKNRIYRSVQHKLAVYFKFPVNRHEFGIDFADNRAQLDTLLTAYYRFANDKDLKIDRVTMMAAASPEGSYESNYRLSERRSKAVKNYLAKNYSGSIDVERLFQSKSLGEDWNMLVKLLRNADHITSRDEILQMALTVTNKNADAVENEIRRKYPKSYKQMREELYPPIRRVDILFDMHRPNMLVKDSVQIEYLPDYAEGLRLIKEHDFVSAIEILKKYGDYNTALCLAALGQPENAYHLLRQLEPTGNVHYLSAIVLYQMGRKTHAANNLLQACALDPNIVFRIPKDAEAKALVREFDLQSKIEELL